MQSYGNTPARSGQMNPQIPVPQGKTAPVGGCGSDNPVKPGKGGASTGFTGGLKPGKV